MTIAIRYSVAMLKNLATKFARTPPQAIGAGSIFAATMAWADPMTDAAPELAYPLIAVVMFLPIVLWVATNLWLKRRAA